MPTKPNFDPSSKLHLVEAQGRKFITYVGLQAKLADMEKTIVSTHTEDKMWPWENPLHMYAVRTTMVVRDKDGRQQVFQGNGDVILKHKDADGREVKGNVGGGVEPHWHRMAETRAHVRCLRQATRSEYAAKEELGGE